MYGLMQQSADPDGYIVHLKPTVHFEVEADDPLEAQVAAMEQLQSAADEAGLTIEDVEIEGAVPNVGQDLQEMVDADGLDTDMFQPPEDTEMAVDEDLSSDTDQGDVLTKDDFDSTDE